jgi:hypothetical protein
MAMLPSAHCDGVDEHNISCEATESLRSCPQAEGANFCPLHLRLHSKHCVPRMKCGLFRLPYTRSDKVSSFVCIHPSHQLSVQQSAAYLDPERCTCISHHPNKRQCDNAAGPHEECCECHKKQRICRLRRCGDKGPFCFACTKQHTCQFPACPYASSSASSSSSESSSSSASVTQSSMEVCVRVRSPLYIHDHAHSVEYYDQWQSLLLLVILLLLLLVILLQLQRQGCVADRNF